MITLYVTSRKQHF